MVEAGCPSGSGPGVHGQPRGAVLTETQLLDTQRAFDSVAIDYDGSRGNNHLIQRMRYTMWDMVQDALPAESRLLDLGCGTGIDALELARCGFQVVATDWSLRMVERTNTRAAMARLGSRVTAMHVGIHQLNQLEGSFDGIYSNFGSLNCVPDLAAVAADCARLLKPGGKLFFSVMGRICPWELMHFALRGHFKRAGVRAAHGAQPVGMNRHTVWTYYYFPREFYAAFSRHFVLMRYRALGLFMPPPYLVDFYWRHRAACIRLAWLDDHLGGMPVLRNLGDHFLIAMQRR